MTSFLVAVQLLPEVPQVLVGLARVGLLRLDRLRRQAGPAVGVDVAKLDRLVVEELLLLRYLIVVARLELLVAVLDVHVARLLLVGHAVDGTLRSVQGRVEVHAGPLLQGGRPGGDLVRQLVRLIFYIYTQRLF